MKYEKQKRTELELGAKRNTKRVLNFTKQHALLFKEVH